MKTFLPIDSLMSCALLLGLATVNASAYKEFTISPEKQTCDLGNGDGTCWAACSDMLLIAYGFPTSQVGIISWAENNTCSDNVVTSPCSGNYIEGTCTSVDLILANFGQIGTDVVYGNLSQSDVDTEIDIGHPIIAHWLYSNGQGHDLLIIGYDGPGGYGSGANTGNIIYNDPLNGTRETKSYGLFVQTGYSPKWDETLRMTTDPATPIGTPVGGNYWVQISPGGTTVITSTTSSLTYSAKNDFSPTTWNWRLILSDENGDIVIYSATQSNSSMKSTWNITNFTLPAGHQWNYNHYGKIPGRVEITATLGTTTASAAEDVVFVPSILYPGNIVFVNETVSSTHADVKAHNSIETISDAIQPAGSISFKAGNVINIQQPLTISNGSNVTFKIDPTLQ